MTFISKEVFKTRLIPFSFIVLTSFLITPDTLASQATDFLSSGRFHTCAQKNLSLKCWGLNRFGQTEVPKELLNDTIRDLASSRDATCAVSSRGKLHCWGDLNIGPADWPLPRANFEELFSYVSPLKNIVKIAMTDLGVCMTNGSVVRCINVCSVGHHERSWCYKDYSPGFKVAKLSATGLRVWMESGHSTQSKPEFVGVKSVWKDVDGQNNFRILWEQIQSTPPLLARQYVECRTRTEMWDPRPYIVCSDNIPLVGSTGMIRPEYVHSMQPDDFSSNTAIAARPFSFCGIKDDKLQCYVGDQPELNLLTPTLLGVGRSHTCVMDYEGVKCWGENIYGQAPTFIKF